MTAIDERECVVLERKIDVLGEEESIYGASPGPHQLSIKQSSFNYKKWRKVWAKWDGREEEHELARWGGEGKKKTQWGVR